MNANECNTSWHSHTDPGQSLLLSPAYEDKCKFIIIPRDKPDQGQLQDSKAFDIHRNEPHSTEAHAYQNQNCLSCRKRACCPHVER